MYSAQSIGEFIKLDDFWSETIYLYYSELQKFQGQFNKDSNKASVIEKISPTVLEIFRAKEGEISEKKSSYQQIWNTNEDLINDYLSSVFQVDASKLFNDLVCNISLNPNSPRYLERKVFDSFYKGDDDYSVGNALHEMTHYLALSLVLRLASEVW